MDLQKLQSELLQVESRINKLQPSGEYTERLSRSFHLGMVGGSGRNNSKLNRIRERELDKTIQRAKILTELYRQRDSLEAKIKDIQEDGPKKREDARAARNERLAKAWKLLQPGQDVALSTGNTVFDII